VLARRSKLAQRQQPFDKGALRPPREGWTWATLEEVGTISSGQTPKGMTEEALPDGEYPWFKVSSMNDEANREHMIKSEWYLSQNAISKLGMNIASAGTIVFPKRGGSILTNKKAPSWR
jgi:type I restriction enzyme, S subunit